MNKNAIILLIIAGLILSVVAFRFATKETVSAESIEDIQKREGVPVDVLTVKPQNFERWRTFSGQIEGKKQAVIYANIPARVLKVHKKQGDKVYKGKVLVSLDPLSATQTYSAQSVARIQYEDAKRMYDRMLPLFEAGAISKEEFDQVKSGVAMAKAGLTDVSYLTRLKSPIHGMLTDLRVSPGDKVDPGQTVATVADISGAKLIMNVSQSDVDELKVGQPVCMGNDKANRSKDSPDGVISKISISADMATRLFRVEVELVTEKSLRPGTLQFVQVLTYSAEGIVKIPLDSVITKNDEKYVYTVTGGGTSEKKPVATGITNEDDYEITGGLAPGDRVVVWGQNRLTGGEKVKVVSQNKEESEKSNDA